jgi:hypothetical protein
VEDVVTADLIHRKASDTTTAENAFGDLEHQSNHQSGDDLVIQEDRFETDSLTTV